MSTPNIGKKITEYTTVSADKLASSVGSGSLDVYATPMVVALMEKAAAALAQEYVDDIYTTVGTAIAIEHISATPENAKVYAEAELTAVEGRVFSFKVTAYDDAGVIAKGTHKRVSVKADSFLKKTVEKFDKEV